MDVNSAAFWQASYENNRFPWDLGGPTPVFERLVRDNWFSPGKMMVLGAGLGHDARLFARSGFEVTAVDFAPEAARVMHNLSTPNAPITILQSDFFQLSDEHTHHYDYVLDYTSFCAIDPNRRSEYAALIRQLLKTDGTLIMLAFPIGKRPGGPPYVVSPDKIIELFNEQQFSLQHREFPVDSVPTRNQVEELLILKTAKLT